MSRRISVYCAQFGAKQLIDIKFRSKESAAESARKAGCPNVLQEIAS